MMTWTWLFVNSCLEQLAQKTGFYWFYHTSAGSASEPFFRTCFSFYAFSACIVMTIVLVFLFWLLLTFLIHLWFTICYPFWTILYPVARFMTIMAFALCHACVVWLLRLTSELKLLCFHLNCLHFLTWHLVQRAQLNNKFINRLLVIRDGFERLIFTWQNVQNLTK